MKNVENYTLGEEIANAVTHGIGTLLAIAALVVLVIFSTIYGDMWYIVSLTIYGSSLVILYTMSTIYHALPRGKTKDIFEIFDHSSIFLLIAGTYTPFELITLRGPVGWTLFGITWGMAVIGILFKVFFVKKFVILSTLIYIIMGWMIVFAIKPLFEKLPIDGIILLIIGGIFYTLGTIFYIRRKMKYHHAIWHLFVIGGSAMHFFAILFYILPLASIFHQ
ncbi:MAG: PAQR family membrane homeostasis protein TrhA [Athalassotoga sp.]|uniref:PAQR family membrane homeostasis protein TrhA n=1 Tax=Athalassotoga sp. TaxID=2022597 RepID=UPI003D071644